MNPFSNKKKIRGWRNQVKKISLWKHPYIYVTEDDFRECERDFVKILIDPWYRLVKRNPPQWYNRLILDSLIEIYTKWYSLLMDLESDFNLEVWLFERTFIRSQIVYDRGSMYGYYDKTFHGCNIQRDFPYHKYTGISYDLTRFSWQLHVDYDYKFKYLDDLSDEDIDKLIRRGYTSEVHKDGDVEDVLYKKIKDYVWIGKIKGRGKNEIK